ncbi:MAG: GtrA family protein [Minisyncoccota bacterium]
MRLTSRDLLFAGINGAFIGILAPFIFSNLSIALPMPEIFLVPLLALLSVLGIASGYILATFIRPFFFQLAKFGLIGVTNTVVDLGLYNLFIFMSDISSGYMISVFKSFSVLAAILNSYVWNKFWSFERKESENFGEEFTQFLLISLIGLLLNVGITSFIVNVISVPMGMPDKAWANIGGLTASVLVLTWNFVGYKFFVFKK